MRILALIAFFAASPAAAASSVNEEQAQAAERISERVTDALDGMLGAGRAKVEIDVVGEHSEINSDAEFLIPLEKPKEAVAVKPTIQPKSDPGRSLLDLPGYAKTRTALPPGQQGPLPGSSPSPSKESPAPPAAAPAPPPQNFNKEHEASRHDAGFQIHSIHATVVFDSALDSGTVREASQLLPQLLNLDTTRGDSLNILRAPMRPVWKSAFSTPSDWRSAAYALGGGLIVLFTALIIFAGMVGAGRALGGSLGRELARARQEPEKASGSAEELPELSPGAAGFLEGEATSGANASGPAAPMLGRRFDFLLGRDPDLIVRAVSTEKPEEISLFFGHLAESIPDLASRLFAHLPPEFQAQVSQSLLKLSVADPERLTALEERLRQAIENGVMGPQSLGRMLSRVPGDARADLLGRLAARDSRAAEEVERHMFSFEDLDGLDAAALRRLLGAVPYETWGPALRGAPRNLIEGVLTDLPEGPRDLVRAAVEVPQPREKIEEARSKILDAYAALLAKGELAVSGPKKGGELI
ncbi:MAG: FliG C-terminal domain-containing protein [Elusimicrobiota bacterium]